MQDRAYRLTYGKKADQVLCRFDESMSVLENLQSVKDLLVARGWLLPDRTLSDMHVDFEGRRLNSQLRIREQGFDVPDNSILHLEDKVTSIALRLIFKPDKLDKRTKIVSVDVNEPLDRQLAAPWKDISENYRFRGLHRRHYSIRRNNRRISTRGTLSGHGIEEDTEVELAPFSFPGYPFWLWEKLVLGVLVIAIILIVIDRLTPPSLPEDYWVTFESKVPCFVTIADADTTILIDEEKAGKAPRVRLKSGRHPLEIMPRANPIYWDTLTVPAVGATDSQLYVVDVEGRWEGRPKLARLAIIAYRGTIYPNNLIKEHVMVNGFPETVGPHDTDVGWLKLNDIPRGPYRIEYQLVGMALDEKQFQYPTAGVLRQKINQYDFSLHREPEAKFIFVYKSQAQLPSD